MTKTQVKNQTKGLKAALSSKGTYDSKKLEDIFEQCRHNEEKMQKLEQQFHFHYLMDQYMYLQKM